MYFSCAVVSVEFCEHESREYSVLFTLSQGTLSNGPDMEFEGEFTVVKLKKVLRKWELATWNKKRIKRLSENNPKTWKELATRRISVLCVIDSSNSKDMHRSMENSEAVEETEMTNGATAQEECVDFVASDMEPRDNDKDGAYALTLRERTLGEREQQLLKRELEMLRNSLTMISTASSNGTIPTPGGIKNIKGLLPEFDGTDNAFWKWKQQLQLLIHSYHLDESSMRTLISSQLKGRALSWFYSIAEYLTLNLEELLKKMEQIFDLCPGKLTLRRKFESRIWRRGEPFCEYYHYKMIRRQSDTDCKGLDPGLYYRGRDGSAIAGSRSHNELPNRS